MGMDLPPVPMGLTRLLTINFYAGTTLKVPKGICMMLTVMVWTIAIV